MNFPLNDVPGFREEMPLMEAFVKIYEVLFALQEKLEKCLDPHAASPLTVKKKGAA